MDKAWKRHEREVAGFFGTQRALHGIDRDQGEVQTDVFVDGAVWGKETTGVDLFHDYAFVIECKYTKQGSSSNSWMLHDLAEISKEPGVRNQCIIPLVVTRDGWHWIQLPNMSSYLHVMHNEGFKKEQVIDAFDIRHLNRQMSTFFDSAIQQARDAHIPRRSDGSSYTRRYHAVCVGSNARLPKCIGFPRNPYVDLRLP